MSYEVLVVDRAGEQIAELENAQISEISWQLNSAGGATFELDALDGKSSEVKLLEREVHFLRDGQLLKPCVPIQARTTRGVTSFQCQGLLWYLSRRFVGRAQRTNLALNPSFETGAVDAGPPDWTPTNVDVAAIINNNRILGTQAVVLQVAAAGRDSFLSQQIFTAVHGATHVVAGWFWIPPSQWIGPATDNRGLYAEDYDLGLHRRSVNYPIDDDTPRGQWIRAEITIDVSASGPPSPQLWVRLYGPGGWIVWDAISVTTEEGIGGFQMDQADLIGILVDHAQDPAFGKSNVGITRLTPATGVLRDRRWEFSDHPNVLTELESFTQLDNGVDFEIGNDRVFRTFFPKKGTQRNDVSIDISGKVGSLDYFEDGSSVATSVVTLADGQGPDREEAGAADSAALGGLVLEDIIPLPDIHIELLDERARAEVDLRKRLIQIPEAVSVDPALIGVVEVGDTIWANIDYGRAQFNGLLRVVGMRLNPRQDSLTFTLNLP